MKARKQSGEVSNIKTAEKVDRFIDALQKGSKNELMDVVSKLNKSDLKEMAVL